MQRFLADRNCGGGMRKRQESKLHLLSVRQIQTLGNGDHHGDRGGFILRVRDEGSVQFVFRYTALNGKRREMGLRRVCRVNATQAGQEPNRSA
jgi:hypothetical protein